MSVNKDIATVQTAAETSLYSENSKLRQTDAVEYFKTLLKGNNLITSKCSSSISHEAMLREELYNYTVDILAEKNMIHDEELKHANEVCEEVFFESVEVDSSSDERSGRLKKKERLPKREENIIKGGNKFDKYALTDSWTYDRFVEAREHFHQVTTRNLQQWALSADGQFKDFEFKVSEREILPKVFVCLQEPTVKFGSKFVEEYSQKYKNIIITSSKSGKLSTELHIDFLQDCLKPYVEKENFLLLVDSWRGQTKPEIYDEVFQDDYKLPTCTLKIIPPKCTPIVQPCDVYFYR
ncbi:HTH CENPB-type domain-containing protein [Trichonephila inaurata madagascariensis]|uniref:HTH CENPB-type domain-containing protein n=1 Tax=Trichonephila inaurata madagascariensis TaxID=2747483 RepID=A0A8X6JXU7_9ARAC|nr:HTH CENPB-type domain-containing protein [Trichonephila inaurata madagascariensis]GFY49352.1 HTH CENPB-type domain-containing protein [Trichonephila inaurata madagascariensis]